MRELQLTTAESSRASMISVVIPLYNKVNTIDRALQSVFRQSVAASQVIVVDDGSTDGGGERVQRITNPALRLVRQPNQGVSVARNHGIQLATTPLVALLDADDEWDETHLADLLETHKRFPDAVAIGTGVRRIDPAGRVRLQRLDSTSHAFLIPDYLGLCARFEAVLLCSSVAIKRDVLLRAGGFPLGIKQGEDLVMWARLSCEGPIAFCPRVTATYYVDVSTKPKPSGPDKVAELLNELTMHPQASAALDEYIATWHRIRALRYWKHDEPAACLTELKYAIKAGRPRARDLFFAVSLVLPVNQRRVLYDSLRARLRWSRPSRLTRDTSSAS